MEPKGTLKDGTKINGTWKLYPSSMGAIMGLNKYKSPQKAIAELWQYSAKEFFEHAIEQKFGKAITTKSYVNRLIREDRQLLNCVTWSIKAKPNEYWKRKMCLGTNGKIMKRLGQILPAKAIPLVYSHIIGYIFTNSGTIGETEALQRVENIDIQSNQNLTPMYIEAKPYNGVITAEVDGWLLENNEIVGIVEHKQRQANPIYELPTDKPEEMVQINLYMHMTNLSKALWVQTNKFGQKQTCTNIEKNPTLVQDILKHATQTLELLNRIYDDETYRNQLLDDSYDPKYNIIWPNPLANEKIV